jgi:hypothetical protein
MHLQGGIVRASEKATNCPAWPMTTDGGRQGHPPCERFAYMKKPYFKANRAMPEDSP